MHLTHQSDSKSITTKDRRDKATNEGVSLPSRTIVHAKLEMTSPQDAEELEADAVASEIVSGGKIRRKISQGGSGSSGIAVSSQMESQLSRLQGGGQQMPSGLQSMMENGFGRDLSQVRLHTDSDAATMSSSIQAKAFTHGNDIYFNQGQYSPETTEGQKLVAHEVTHVVQGNGKVAREDENSDKSSSKTNDNLIDKNPLYSAKTNLGQIRNRVTDAITAILSSEITHDAPSLGEKIIIDIINRVPFGQVITSVYDYINTICEESKGKALQKKDDIRTQLIREKNTFFDKMEDALENLDKKTLDKVNKAIIEVSKISTDRWEVLLTREIAIRVKGMTEDDIERGLYYLRRGMLSTHEDSMSKGMIYFTSMTYNQIYNESNHRDGSYGALGAYGDRYYNGKLAVSESEYSNVFNYYKRFCSDATISRLLIELSKNDIQNHVY